MSCFLPFHESGSAPRSRCRISHRTSPSRSQRRRGESEQELQLENRRQQEFSLRQQDCDRAHRAEALCPFVFAGRCRLKSLGGCIEGTGVPQNPVGLARIWREQRKSHQPTLARLPGIALGFQFFGFSREAVQLIGVDQSMALIAHQCSGRELVGAAPAVSNQFGCGCRHDAGALQFYARGDLVARNRRR